MASTKYMKGPKKPMPRISTAVSRATGTNWGEKEAGRAAKEDMKAGRSSDRAKSKTKKDTSRLGPWNTDDTLAYRKGGKVKKGKR